MGAVRPELRPSWLTAEPRITASTRSPSRRASESRLSTTTPQPSLRTKPFAAASKVLQRPSSASISGNCENEIAASGATTALTPPAIARSHSPSRRFWQAWCTATSEEEQAVSTETLGPRRSSR